MPVSSKLVNSKLTQIRRPKEDPETIQGGPSITFENKNGDVMVFTPAEARYALKAYIDEELNLYADATVLDYKTRLEERINFKIKQLEISLVDHVNSKVDVIVEKILASTVNRVFEEEVNKRLNVKLEKIKNSL
jgi:hypothetical protein